MSKKFKKLLVQFGNVVGTAAVAAAIAFIQNMLSSKGIDCGPQMSVEETGLIGTGAAVVRAAIAKVRFFA